jgi:hypothetical protein
MTVKVIFVLLVFKVDWDLISVADILCRNAVLFFLYKTFLNYCSSNYFMPACAMSHSVLYSLQFILCHHKSPLLFMRFFLHGVQYGCGTHVL